MEDRQIIELILIRDERGLLEAEQAYKRRLLLIAEADLLHS